MHLHLHRVRSARHHSSSGADRHARWHFRLFSQQPNIQITCCFHLFFIRLKTNHAALWHLSKQLHSFQQIIPREIFAGWHKADHRKISTLGKAPLQQVSGGCPVVHKHRPCSRSHLLSTYQSVQHNRCLGRRLALRFLCSTQQQVGKVRLQTESRFRGDAGTHLHQLRLTHPLPTSWLLERPRVGRRGRVGRPSRRLFHLRRG